MNKKQWGAILIIGVTIRLLLSQIGFNHDITAYNLVGELVCEGKNVYANTNKFNYGFIMAYVFGGIYWLNSLLFSGEMQGMHFLVCLLCSIFDILTANKLKKHYGEKVALLYYLNPILILITGYHTQFDTIAIYFGLLCWLKIKEEKWLWKAVGLLGLSLIIKHVFLLFLPWLLFDKRIELKKRIFIFSAPLVIFFGSFIPFVLDTESREGVHSHVFSYNSFENHSLLGRATATIPNFNNINSTYVGGNLQKYLFMGILTLFGAFCMRRNPEESFYLYLLALVAFSSGMTDQYLAITCLSLALFNRNKALWLFAFVAIIYLIFDTRNNISGSIVFLQQFTDNSPLLGKILSVATCQFLLIIALINHFVNGALSKQNVNAQK